MCIKKGLKKNADNISTQRNKEIKKESKTWTAVSIPKVYDSKLSNTINKKSLSPLGNAYSSFTITKNENIVF